MKTNGLFIFAADSRHWRSLYPKMVFVSLILALLFASLPVGSVLAAPASDEQPWENIDLEKEWNNKLRHLRTQGFYYDHVRLYPADFESRADLALAQMYLDKYGFALRQANTVVFNHYGFDFEGNVTNERQAYETIHDLAMYLQMMRGLRDKIAAIPDGK
jgi:hypothetical protein